MMKTRNKPAITRNAQQSLEDYLAEKAARMAEYAARDEDTPEKVEWFKRGIARRRMELGWGYADV